MVITNHRGKRVFGLKNTNKLCTNYVKGFQIDGHFLYVSHNLDFALR